MAVGTSAGLLDSPRATSVFKHEILRQYTTPFLAKVASGSPGGRVMVIDGFAGRGRFDDGAPGSAELFMGAASRLTNAKTSVRLFEKNRSDAVRLGEVAAEYAAKGLDVTAAHGDITSLLEPTVNTAVGIPLFLLLDPCGQNVPFDVLSKVLAQMRAAKRPATEALLNLSADFTRRIGGALKKGIGTAGITTMDRMMGGEWWQEIALYVHSKTPDGTWGRASDAVAYEYVNRLGAVANMDGVLVPVRRKPDNQPTYHLAFLTRSADGHWVMADALARARQAWLREIGPQKDDAQGSLFDDAPIGELIAGEQKAAMGRTETRVLEVAARAGTFSLIPNVLAIYGDDLGTLTESNLGKVMGELVKEKKLDRQPGAKLGKAVFTYKH